MKPTQTKTSRTSAAAHGPSIREVAHLAQVGLGTVSRVINGNDNVSDKTRAKVLSAIAELGYVPDMIAQSMRNRRTMTFACVVRDFTVPVLAKFVDAMQNEIDSAGFSLIVASSYHDPRREAALLQGLQQRRIDGLVITTSSESDPALLALLENAPFPVVLLDREKPASLDAVLVDHAHGTRQAVDHLVDLGHRRIGIISGEPGLHPTTSRITAYQAALRKHGIPRSSELIRLDSFGADAGYVHAQTLLSLKERPTAIIAGGTAFLPGLIRAARDLKLRIPDDLSIISGAVSDVGLLMEPSITTIGWHHDQLGKAAGRLLIERLAEPARAPQHLVFPSGLLMGGSCAAPATR